jgi:hypothetical protein
LQYAPHRFNTRTFTVTHAPLDSTIGHAPHASAVGQRSTRFDKPETSPLFHMLRTTSKGRVNVLGYPQLFYAGRHPLIASPECRTLCDNFSSAERDRFGSTELTLNEDLNRAAIAAGVEFVRPTRSTLITKCADTRVSGLATSRTARSQGSLRATFTRSSARAVFSRMERGRPPLPVSSPAVSRSYPKGRPPPVDGMSLAGSSHDSTLLACIHSP